MPPSFFPLRWESTGDQWWYASPIDFAAANGHYDLVRELLHLDPNLLIKLTSLRRIRRLETVWDDEEQFNDVAKCRSLVAKKLLLACESEKGHNSLIRAGYGGWLLYTAASAGDLGFMKTLLERDPLLVFGEGEYGVTDVLYAAARSKNCDAFRMLLDFSFLRQEIGEENNQIQNGGASERHCYFREEMMNRAVHAAARGGNLEVLKELLGDFCDEFGYRDAQGSTVLHTASGRGQVEVVKALIASFNFIASADYQGNTALHVAAYRGYLTVVEVLIQASSSLIPITNNYGDTFLHMAVSGFRTPGFRRVDRQIELMKQLVSGKTANLQDIINITNNEGRTALHIAVIENIHSNLVELLMTVPSIDLNIRDVDGMTPLDFLKQRPRTASSEILIKQLISAGGISNCQDSTARNAIASQLRGQCIGRSPGTSFRIPDAEIFLYTGIENASQDNSCELTSIDYSTNLSEVSEYNTPNSVNLNKSSASITTARHLKSLLQWPRKKEKKTELEDNDSLDSFSLSREDRPVPLRQRFSKLASFSSTNKRVLSFRNSLPSPLTRRKFTAGLSQGVIRTMPQFAESSPSPRSASSLMASPVGNTKEKSSKPSLKHKQLSFNKKLMNQYLCFGAQGVAVENSCAREERSFKHSTSLVA
ncbi:Ankyrin repeat family protein [Euphorbia peplus]|nr:Ankyrin repeat family protein [Euphorbia peplus]